MPLHIYVGFDAIDHLAYRVLEASILDQTSETVEIYPLRDWQLRGQGFYRRPYLMQPSGQKLDVIEGRPHSTEFSFTRFLTPIIHREKQRDGPCLFMDADMMIFGDIKDLFNLTDPAFDVMVVKHTHTPPEKTKIVGVVQQQYKRKNWASVMLFPKAEAVEIGVDDVSYMPREWLHGFDWTEKIGSLPEEWNWLEGWSPTGLKPRNVHFTRGTPDLPGYETVAYAKEYWEWAKKAGWRDHNEP